MTNLKNETLEILQYYGKSVKDVCWVGSKEREIPLDEFWKEADRNYDSGYGSAEVNKSLMVVGEDWWLERHEYDGAEWWEYKEHPTKPIDAEAEDIINMIFYDD